MRTNIVLLPALFLAFAIIAPVTAAETSPLACLPVESGDQGTPVIRARVNGQGPFAFVLDTAASGTTIDPERTDKLALPRDAATEQAQGMGGEITVHFHRVRSISAGPLTKRDVIVPSLPAPAFESHDIAGLAGVDLFGDRLAVWTPGSPCVGVAASGSAPGKGAWRPIEANWLQPWKIMLSVRINGVAGWGLLDTGAQHSVINPAFADAIGLTGARLRPSGSITGIDGREMPLVEGDIPAVVIGPWRWDERSVRVGALPVFSRLSAAGDNLIILGMDWLQSEGFAIDYGKQRLWLLERTPG